MSEEEEDYMSDKFLSGIQDVRPSLMQNRAKKRQIEVAIKHQEHIKKQKEVNKASSAVLDNQRLQAALSKPLEEANKGFKLLAKMGYKPGQALGKATTSKDTDSARLLEPIGITLKTDRQGLGREAALKELNEMQQKIRQQRLRKKLGGDTTIEDFRRRTNQKHEEKFVLNALRRCQVTCENLDVESNVQTPELPWFWVEKTKETEDESEVDSDNKEELEEDIEVFSSQEKLEMLTKYLRISYLFCYWCGVRYNDEKDLQDNCPGLTKDEH